MFNMFFTGVATHSRIKTIGPFELQLFQTTQRFKPRARKRSLGYETMTTLSDTDSMVSSISTKYP